VSETTSVADLKARTSEILRRVKSGQEILITERGVPVARIQPLDDAQRRSTRRTRLARAGLLRPGKARLPRLLAAPPEGRPSGVVEALVEERREPEDR
jgi:prevent-host-death family protein